MKPQLSHWGVRAPPAVLQELSNNPVRMGDLSEFYDVDSSDDDVVPDSLPNRSVHVAPSRHAGRSHTAAQEHTRGRSRGSSSKRRVEPSSVKDHSSSGYRNPDSLSLGSCREPPSLDTGTLERSSQELTSIQGHRVRRPR